MIEMSLLDMVLITLGVLLSMAFFSCLCCLCMKFSDLKMKWYLIELAKRKGVQVDLDTPNPTINHQSPSNSDHCTIIVPEVGIIF